MMKWIVSALVATAIAAPAAQAADRGVSPDDRSVSRATSPTLQAQSTSPDDRALNRATSPALRAPNLGADDRALPRATVDIRETPQPVQVIVRQPRGFDWGDALTGALAAGGLAAVLAALAIFGLRRRSLPETHRSPRLSST